MFCDRVAITANGSPVCEVRTLTKSKLMNMVEISVSTTGMFEKQWRSERFVYWLLGNVQY